VGSSGSAAGVERLPVPGQEFRDAASSVIGNAAEHVGKAREVDGIHILVASDDVFERARALNAGSAIANHELIVWQDNDLTAATASLGARPPSSRHVASIT
jgi:hypothetical protein